jgi:flagellar protein FlbD
MIRVKRRDNSILWVNVIHILHIEQTPETMITLTNGEKMMLTQPLSEIVKAIDQELCQIGLKIGSFIPNDIDSSV